MDGSDINAVARSHSGHLLATSDDLGRVNLFRYTVSPLVCLYCVHAWALPIRQSNYEFDTYCMSQCLYPANACVSLSALDILRHIRR